MLLHKEKVAQQNLSSSAIVKGLLVILNPRCECWLVLHGSIDTTFHYSVILENHEMNSYRIKFLKFILKREREININGFI